MVAPVSRRLLVASAEVARRLVEKPQPPPEFNPLRASDEELAAFGIAPRPPETEHPVLSALWREALSPPMRLEAVQLADLTFDPSYRLTGLRKTVQAVKTALGPGQSRQTGSTNWSGAYVVANRYRRFTAIGATWRVPTPEAPKTAGGGLTDGDYRVATWVGLDGNFRRSQSLPQAGTTQAVVVAGGAAAAPTYSVWFQWWVRDQLFPPVTFDAVKYPVGAENRMVCILAVNSTSDAVYVLMANLSKLWTLPLLYIGDNPLGLSVEGSTAEWIVERPTDLNPPFPVFPLPDYGQVEFQSCAATQAHDPLFGAPVNLDNARRVRMRLDVTGPPHRSAIISRAEKLGAHSLRTHYIEP